MFPVGADLFVSIGAFRFYLGVTSNHIKYNLRIATAAEIETAAYYSPKKHSQLR